jgi:hypothetical protein
VAKNTYLTEGINNAFAVIVAELIPSIEIGITT